MVSIIVPVYNAEKYILETIDMVRKQTFTDWELILVNDCSGDRSAGLIRQHIRELKEQFGESRIRLIDKKVNEGAAKARNTGLDAACGRYVAFLDADDIWRENKLERELDYLRKEAGSSGFVFTAYDFGDEAARPTGRTCRVPKTLNYSQALSRTIIFTSTVLFDTEVIDKKLLYMPQIASEDTATWWRILQTGTVACGLDEPLVIYRRPAGSLSSDKGKAVPRIWNLYRKIGGLSIPAAAFYTVLWAFRATWRRVVPDRLRSEDKN